MKYSYQKPGQEILFEFESNQRFKETHFEIKMNIFRIIFYFYARFLWKISHRI